MIRRPLGGELKISIRPGARPLAIASRARSRRSPRAGINTPHPQRLGCGGRAPMPPPQIEGALTGFDDPINERA